MIKDADYPPTFDGDNGPRILFGSTSKFQVAVGVLRAVRVLALSSGDDDLTEYCLKLQAAVLEWVKILPKDEPTKEIVGTDGPYR